MGGSLIHGGFVLHLSVEYVSFLCVVCWCFCVGSVFVLEWFLWAGELPLSGLMVDPLLS